MTAIARTISKPRRRTIRSGLISVAIFLAAVGTFVLVVHPHSTSLTAIAPQTQPTSMPVRLTTQTTSAGMGAGQSAWANEYKQGRLVSQFTATKYDPQKDGSVLVDRPVAVFYQSDGEYLLVTGDTGVVNFDRNSGPSGNSAMGGPMKSPSDGLLQHVRLSIYQTRDSLKPKLWMETNNLRFDNDTQALYTQTFTDSSGKTTPSDMVPVTVRGDEYEFDGTGLTMHWNPVDHKLALLEIAHGDRLELINPSRLSMPGSSEIVPAAPTGASKKTISRDNSAAVILTALPAKKPAPVAPPVPYRAVFNERVRIEQLSQTVATADVMTVDFLEASSGERPVTAPKQSSSPPVDLGEEPVAPAAANQAATTRETLAATEPSSRPTTLPTTKPNAGPVTIYWKGKLRITPLQTPPLLPLLPGQSAVRMTGSPVHLSKDGAEAFATDVLFRSNDDKIQMHSGPGAPAVRLIQSKGLRLITDSMEYDPETCIATLLGNSKLELPVGEKKQFMRSSWTTRGLIHFIPPKKNQQPQVVDRVDLEGSVVVEHPLFGLTTDSMHLDLEAVPATGGGASQEQLKGLIATGSAECRLTPPGKPVMTITSDKLAIGTERGKGNKTVPRTLVADGNVHAFDPLQSLRAGHLQALMMQKSEAPTTRTATTHKSDEEMVGTVDLQSMLAQSAVHAVLKDGTTADAENLQLDTTPVGQIVKLWDENGATVATPTGSFLTGPVVQMSPDKGWVRVPGAGSLRTIEKPKPTTNPTDKQSKPRPIDVAWTQSMFLDTAKNVADVVGGVTVLTTDADGARTRITGDTAHLDLMDNPKPTTKKSATSQPDESSLLGNKALQKLTLTGNVRGETMLLGTGGSVVHQALLKANQLEYLATDGSMTVPGPGQLFVENNEPSKGSDSSNRGKMAIAWRRRLIYDQTSQLITIDGDVKVGIEQTGGNSKDTAPMQLDARQLILAMKKVGTAKPGQTDDRRLALAKMTATGDVHFSAREVACQCHQVLYDPDTQLLTAIGNRDEPGQTTDAAGTAVGSFDSLNYDVKNRQVLQVLHLRGSIRR